MLAMRDKGGAKRRMPSKVDVVDRDGEAHGADAHGRSSRWGGAADPTLCTRLRFGFERAASPAACGCDAWLPAFCLGKERAVKNSRSRVKGDRV
jgi:hypothetical protein